MKESARENSLPRVYSVEDFLRRDHIFKHGGDFTVTVRATGTDQNGPCLVFRVHTCVLDMAAGGSSVEDRSPLTIFVPNSYLDNLDNFLTFFALLYTSSVVGATASVSTKIERENGTLLLYLASKFDATGLEKTVKQFVTLDISPASFAFYYEEAKALDVPHVQATAVRKFVCAAFDESATMDNWKSLSADFLFAILDFVEGQHEESDAYLPDFRSKLTNAIWHYCFDFRGDLTAEMLDQLMERFLRLEHYNVKALWSMARFALRKRCRSYDALALACMDSLGENADQMHNVMSDIFEVCDAHDIYHMFPTQNERISTVWSLSLRLRAMENLEQTEKIENEFHRALSGFCSDKQEAQTEIQRLNAKLAQERKEFTKFLRNIHTQSGSGNHVKLQEDITQRIEALTLATDN